MDSSTLVSDKPRAVCIPFPIQSHIKAMLKFSKLLHHTHKATEGLVKQLQICDSKARNPNSSLTMMMMVRTWFGIMPLKDLTMERKRVEEFEESLSMLGTCAASGGLAPRVTRESQPPTLCFFAHS
uniref:Uncharacterized protein n=1 Tax=Quercus lobata TaxID=97700 RepID=A0A7N2N350_QUELO